MSAIRSPEGAAADGASATAALRALRLSRLGRLLHLDALPFLQLAGERPVRSVDDRLAVLDALEDLDVRPARGWSPPGSGCSPRCHAWPPRWRPPTTCRAAPTRAARRRRRARRRWSPPGRCPGS